MAYFLICRLGWHRTGPPLPSSVGPRRLQPPFERFMEPAGSQTALTCCLWQPEGRRLAPLADNMLFVPLPSLTRFRCHHTRFSHSVCLALSLSVTLSLSYSLSLSLSFSLSVLSYALVGRMGGVWKTVEHFITDQQVNPVQIDSGAGSHMSCGGLAIRAKPKLALTHLSAII